MIHAAMGHCVAFLEYLVDQGADVNTWDSDFALSPLQAACARDVPGEMALRLLQLGADPLKTSPNIPSTCLSVLAFNRLGPLSLSIVREMVQRGCTYGSQPVSFANLYAKSVRENDVHLAQFLLDQEGVSRKSLEETSPLGSLLQSLLIDNTQSSISPIQKLVNREPRPSIIVSEERRWSVFHQLSMTPELTRNEGLNERLARFLMTEYDPDVELLNLTDIYGRTAISVAVMFGNHRLLRLLLAKGADPYCGEPSFSLPVSLMRKITSILDLEKTGDNVAAEVEWKQKVRKVHNNTVQLLAVALEYLPELGKISLTPAVRQSEDILSQIVQKWRDPESYQVSGAAALQKIIGDIGTIEVQGSSFLVVGKGNTKRGPSREEFIEGK